MQNFHIKFTQFGINYLDSILKYFYLFIQQYKSGTVIIKDLYFILHYGTKYATYCTTMLFFFPLFSLFLKEERHKNKNNDIVVKKVPTSFLSTQHSMARKVNL